MECKNLERFTVRQKDELNLMHIAICRLLEPYGFYEFEFLMKMVIIVLRRVTTTKSGETVLMKEAIVSYFMEREL
jgi:hypothetical protein